MASEIVLREIEAVKKDLESRDSIALELAVQNLCERLLGNSDDANFCRKLTWLQLIAEAYHLKNDHLCLLIVQKLGLYDLSLSLHFHNLAANEVLERVANYFSLDDGESKPTHGDSQQSTETFGTGEPDAISQGYSMTSTKMIEYAQDHESDEDFELASKYFEKLGSHEHIIRLAMKLYLCSAELVQNHCTTYRLLQNTWFEYLIASKCLTEATSFGSSCGDTPSSMKGSRLTDGLRRELQATIPGDILGFLMASRTKWSKKEQIDAVASSWIGLSQEQKMLIAEVASYYLERNDISSSLCLIFCLNESDLMLEPYLADCHHGVALEGLSRFCPKLHATSLVHRLVRQYHTGADDQMIISACSMLGLLDETVHLCSVYHSDTEHLLNRILEQVEMMANNENKLSSLDPVISKRTSVVLLQTLKRESNRDLNMNMISLMVHANRIILQKLVKLDVRSACTSFRVDLESMLESLLIYLSELEFGISDRLIQATNSLLLVIKDNFDALSDNKILRDSVKRLVDTVAGQCLIEAHYKSAAILFSQVGDNVNAIKSLMRTGEVQTVVEYALLVRDITVNRITINFMKHLKVDSRLIEDFTTRTRP